MLREIERKDRERKEALARQSEEDGKRKENKMIRTELESKILQAARQVLGRDLQIEDRNAEEAQK